VLWRISGENPQGEYMQAPVITLCIPIDTPEQDQITTLRFKRRMNGGDIAAAGIKLDLGGDAAFTLSAEQVNLISSRCTGLPVKVIEQLDGSDWMQLFQTVTGFFTPPQVSGEQG